MKFGGKVLILSWLLLVFCGCSDAITVPAAQTSPQTSAAVAANTTTAPTIEAGISTVTALASLNAERRRPSLNPATASVSTPIPTVSSTAVPTTAISNAPSSTVAPTAAGSVQVSQRQLGQAGCCQAFGFGNANRLYYYDKISGRTGTYTLDISNQQSQLQFLSSQYGLFSQDLSLVAVSDRPSGTTTIQQVGDGVKRATLQNRASPTLISPDKTRLVYLLRSLNQDGPEAPQRFELWVGNIDGSGLQKIWDLREGANLAWFPNSHSVLLTARDAANQRFGLWAVSTDAQSGQGAKLIVESKGLIEATLSSDGAKVAYAITFQGETNSGVWSADADGTNRRKFAWTGGWRWSPTNPGELLYIPVRAATEPANALWSFDFNSGQATRLTDPTITPLPIVGDQWQVALDGKSLSYRSAKDNGLWLLRFR